MSILDHWSHPTSPPRKGQVTALEWMEKETAKYLILESPVGSGKSNIGITLSRSITPGVGKSYILTPQKILQSQYARDFSNQNLFALYGKSNYSCSRGPEITCDIGSQIRPQCPNCPHKAAKERACSSANLALNYKLALLYFTHTDLLDKRPLMILDECHQTEEALVELDAVNITMGKCKRLGIPWEPIENLALAADWLANEYAPALDAKLIDLEEVVEHLLSKVKPSAKDSETINEYNELEGHNQDVLHLLAESVSDTFSDDFVLVLTEGAMKFKRLTAAYSFKKILEPFADRFLFMSSTILNRKQFCDNLGIDESETAFLSLDSDFPPDQRPVYYMPQCKMNAKWKTEENELGRQRLLNQCHELATMHKDDSGIIHTGNFAITQWLVENLNTTHEIIHHLPDSLRDRASAIDYFHANNTPSILISPSITEGLDLKEDLARFAIIAKIPFGSLGDSWIKKRMQMSKDWYQTKALIDVIQGGGRIVRSKDDWGNVYILDASWGYLYKTVEHNIPKWWKEGYCVYE